MGVCGTISAGVAQQCPPNSPISGTVEDFWLINSAEMGTYNYDAATGIIDSYTLATGTFTRKIEGSNNSTAPSSQWQDQGLYGNFQHRLEFIFPSLSALDMIQYGKLALGSFVAFVEKKYPGENKIFVMGLGSGLRIIESSWEFNNADRNGLPFLVLGTKEGDQESNPPLELLTTDFVTTKNNLIGLETTAAI